MAVATLCPAVPARAWTLFLLTLLVVALGCTAEPAKKLPSKAHTSTELRGIRRGVEVVHAGESARAPFARERLGEGAEIKIAEGGLAWLRRDGGATLLVRGPARISVEQAGLRLHEGRAFAETPAGVTETLQSPQGALVLSAVKASVEAAPSGTTAYVLAGEIRSGTKAAAAGEFLSLEGEKVDVRPAAGWEDWTGGMATTDPANEPAPFGVGTVGARRPGASGAPHTPLSIQRLDVRVTIEGDLSTTEVDQTFFNPLSETVEGVYRLRIPEEALLERFGVDREGGVVFGYVKEKKQAQAQYEAKVYEGSKEDPALLAWRDPGVYEARLYPIHPGATRRVIVRYTEWLSRSGDKGQRRLYVYPMASEGSARSAPQVEDLSISVDISKAGAKDVRSGMQATRLGDLLLVEGHDFVPRADLTIELFDDGVDKVRVARAKHAPDLVALGPAEQADARRTGAGEADYLLVPVRASDLPARPEGLDLVLVVDTSAATSPGMLRLARAATRALLTHLGPKDRVLVVTGDDKLEPVVGARAELAPVDDAMRSEVLARLTRVTPGGATDLGAMLAEAVTKISAERASAIVYIGDGAPTVGETDVATVRARLGKTAKPARIFALGTGETANMALLDGVTSGGFAERIGDDRSAARAALRLLEMAERRSLLGVTLDVGATVERTYPRDLGAVVEGETTLVVGRLTGDVPKEVHVTAGGATRSLAVEASTVQDSGDLRRRWAQGRLDEMLAEGAGHAALVDLGVRQGIITPVTSIYVPTTGEMTGAQRAQAKQESKLRSGRLALEAAQQRALRAQNQAALEEQDEEPGVFGGLFSRSKKSESATASADNKEGGTGTRAKGEEGSMGTPPAQAAATAQPQAPAASPPSDDAMAAEGRMRRDTQDKDFAPSPTEPAPAAAEPPSTKPTPRQGGDGFFDQDGAPLEAEKLKVDQPARPASPGAMGGVGLLGPGSGGGGRREQAASQPADVPETGNTQSGKVGDDRGANEQILLPEGDVGGAHGIKIHVTVDDPGRLRRLCGAGADLPFEERRGLWRERLSKTGGNAAQVLAVYRSALALCEAPTQRERRALLLLGLDVLPSVAAKVSLYRLLARDTGAADVVYRGILSRVTTPAQVRELNQALGLVTVDSVTLEKTIKEAKDSADLVARLRGLAAKFPSDLGLALRVVDALEDHGDDAGARELARALRARPDADASVRTAIGELYLRLATRGTDPAQKALDEREAKRAFGELVEFSPDDPVARRRLGDLYRAHGYYQEATRQYETLARLVPDDPSVPILLAATANGLGKLEEAVRWTEKGGQAGAPDASQGPHATARAYAATFLAWGRLEARAAGRTDEVKALAARLDRVLGASGLEKRGGQVRVVLTWAHPELHPTLWHTGLGSLMPAAEGDTTLGISQALVPDKPTTLEVRVEPADLERTARLGAKAVLTVVIGEGKDAEVVDRRDVTFRRGGASTLRFSVEGGRVQEVAK